jgi:small subunit ribosomal protein S4
LARYKDSKFKLCRRAGTALSGVSQKYEKSKRQTLPGQHGAARKKLSEYAIQLAEKQKVRNTYGMLEKQFRRVYDRAVKHQGVTGTVLLQLLESRLDNVVYRSGLVATRAQARQMINHGHILVDGQKVDIPSYQVKPSQIITVREKSRASFKQLKELSPYQTVEAPHWLSVDEDNLVVKFVMLPDRGDLDATINEALVIEYYSR